MSGADSTVETRIGITWVWHVDGFAVGTANAGDTLTEVSTVGLVSVAGSSVLNKRVHFVL